jgi:hypothetical protein
VTGSPDFFSNFAVPPVESRPTPKSASALANSTTPVLSETLISACLRAVMIWFTFRNETARKRTAGGGGAHRGAVYLMP